MTTEPKMLTFLEVLRLKNCELWESKLNHFTLTDKGDLQLLYQHAQDTMVLKLHGTSWVLEKDLQIIGTQGLPGSWQAYSLVTPGGFFCLKLSGLDFTGPHPELANFETVLENRANFVRNNSLEARINLFGHPHNESGLAQIKDVLKKAAQTFAHTIGTTDYENHPNYQIYRPYNDILDVDSTNVPVVDISEFDLGNAKIETQMLIKDHQGVGEWSSFWSGNQQNYQGFQQRFEQLNLGKEQGQQQSQSLFQPLKGGELQGLPSGQFKGQPHPSLQNQQFQKSDDVERLDQERIGEKESAPGVIGQKLNELGSQECPPGIHHHDQQEGLGNEFQRLPSYEVSHSHKDIHQGFKQAGTNIQGGVTEDISGQDSTEFTTGLLKDDIEPEKPSPVTPYHKNEMQNPPLTLNPASDISERKDLPKEKSEGEAPHEKLNPASDLSEGVDLPKESLNMQSWGSNVTNPSETTPNIEAEFGSNNNLPRSKEDNRTTLEKLSNASDNMKETAAP